MAPREGGPPRVVAGLVAAQRALAIDAQVLCGDEPALAAEHAAYWQAQGIGFPAGVVHGVGGESLLARRAALHRWLAAHLAEFDIVHVHQLWRLVPTLAANAVRRVGKPYLIAPHTSLSPWALQQKSGKKALARWLVWNRIFRGAAGFHALNELEAAEIRTLFAAARPAVFVVPNGVALEEFATERLAPVPAAFAGRFSVPEGAAPFVLFLARLHTMKGPDLLLEAFAALAREYPQLQLVYAGPDFGMQSRLQQRAATLGMNARIHFLGLVTGAERLWLLHHALCLCQPSRDEGFSLTILEALACERPVVISDRCKFPQVATAQAGLIVPTAVAPLTAALSEYLADPARRARDGLHGRALVEGCYTWDKVAKLAENMYRTARTVNSRTAVPGAVG